MKANNELGLLNWLYDDSKFSETAKQRVRLELMEARSSTERIRVLREIHASLRYLAEKGL